MKGEYVGRAVTRIDARAKVTGEAQYPGDFNMDDQLYMKILFAERPHARVVHVDTSEAEQVPGFVAAFTAADVPVNEYGLQYPDQPVLCGPGSDKEGTDVVRFVGDQVAVVVAETEDAAMEAREKIHVTYEELPVIDDPREAIREEAPHLHPPYPGTDIHPELVFEGNVASRHRIRRGEVEAVWEEAAAVVEADYVVPSQEHIFLQPEAGVGYVDEKGRITIVVGTQWAHEDRHQIAHALDLPEEQIRVIIPAVGGAFGGREDMSVQIVLALAVRKLQRPIKIVWSREESIMGHHKRHRVFAHARWAVDAEGHLLAAETEVIADAGAYVYTTNKVLGNLLLTVNGPYRIPNVKTAVYGVYTNNIPSGAFRGFGAPQGNFIAESQMNKLAEALDIDPVELRLRNVVVDAEAMPWGKALPEDPRGLKDALIAVARSLGWRQTDAGWVAPRVEHPKPHLRRGLGIALGFKNVGYSFGYQENAWAGIELRGGAEIEEALVFAASSDVGQGARTVIKQMAAEALDLSLDKVRVEDADTAMTESAGSCSASRMTFMIGNAIQGAARIALEKWRDEERPAKGMYTYLAPETTQIDPETGYGDPNFSYGYAAIGVDVIVDTETGEYTFPKIVCANDVGQAINPRLLEGQIEGGVVQGLGWATTENFVQEDGYPLSDDMGTYLVPSIADIPTEVEAIIIENAEEKGPWGARGMAEMPFLPVAAAVYHAMRQATGLWHNAFPFTVERVLRGLKGKI